MVRPTRLLAATMLLLASCGGEPPLPATSSPPGTSTPTSAPVPSPPPSPGPEPSPGTMPTGYDADVAAQEVPVEALIPVGASATGEWFAFTDRGVMIVVSWAEPGGDITELPRGVAVWRRTDAVPHWRLATVRRHGPNAGLTEIQATAADVTADGSDDVLLFEGTSGTGGCGSWLVLELLTAKRIFRRELCDARIEPGPPDAPGLVVTESVYRPGDAHCCPSAIRRTTLAWTGSSWQVTERTQSET